MSGRDLRCFEPWPLVEVTMVVRDHLYLLRPSKTLNDIILGVVGRAQRLTGLRICGFQVMSTHLHLLVQPSDPKQLADFERFINGNLCKEGKRLRNGKRKRKRLGKGALWEGRYQMVVVSDEEAAQMARLKYLLDW